jgi:transposase
MTRSIAITRTDHTATELRGLAAGRDDGAQVRRLLALVLTLEGHSRTRAAERCGMQRQTLRDWVHRYNAQGVAGLTTRGGRGRPPALSARRMTELKALVIEGPDAARHDVVGWRCVDPRHAVAHRFTVEVHERMIGKWLRKLG